MKKNSKKDAEIILRSALFAGIEPEELETLLQCLAALPREHKKGELVFLAGDRAVHVGLVCSGAVQIVKEDVMGNRSILSQVGPGELFGEAFACAKTEKLPVSAIAAADSRILFLDYRRVVTTCPAGCPFHSRLIENMLGILAGKNVLLSQKIEILSRRSTREKLIAYLSGQAALADSRRFTIPFNRQELADYLCVERSAMSAALSGLRREGVLRYQRSEFEFPEN